jgi:hypothetical protein
LLLERDENGETLLFKAVSLLRKKYVVCFLNAATARDAVQIPAHRSRRNCLHAAVAAQPELLEDGCIDLFLDQSAFEYDSSLLSRGDADGNTPLHLAVALSSCVDLDGIGRLIKSCGDALRVLNGRNESPYIYRVHQRQDFWDTKDQNLEGSHDYVLELLMLSCMRLYLPDEASRILYGEGQGRKFCF